MAAVHSLLQHTPMNSTPSSSIELLPFFPSFTFLDIFLPPFLVALSLLLHSIYNDPLPDSIHAHIFSATTAHARFLPTVATHIFSYPVLFFGLDLELLESRHLDLDRLFAYAPTRWTLTSLRPNGYLDVDPIKTRPRGIREKLLAHLVKAGVDREDAGTIYCVTMPGYMGFEGINPLTIHFCYKKNEFDLKAVVLEVHNTFGERHVYVLRVGVAEDLNTSSSRFDHRWTFPRSFHVSPFNDRSGFYCVSLSNPLSSLSPPHINSLPPNPTLNIKIIFLTPSHEKKIYASLTGVGVPLTSGALLSSLLRLPFSLLLTTPRILWQATKLHYSKRLDVFPRPEPFQEELSDEANPVEKGGKVGAVGWQPSSATDEWAKEKMLTFLKKRVEDLAGGGRDVKIVLQSSDISQLPITITSQEASETLPQELLTITYLTPLFFTDLFTSPSIPLALSLANKITFRWKTSNDILFLDLFQPPISDSLPPSRLSNLTSKIRLAIMTWSLSFSRHPSQSSHSLLPSSPPPHPLDMKPSVSLAWHLFLHFFTLKLGYWIFVASHARFVKGRESWTEWARLEELKSKSQGVQPEVKFGSVVRPLGC